MYSSYDVDRFGIIRWALANEIGVTERVGQANSAGWASQMTLCAA
jgi:hypothetical protein